MIFPPLASVYSALGSLVTPARLDLVRSELSRLDQARQHVLLRVQGADGQPDEVDEGPAPELLFRVYLDHRGEPRDVSVDLGCVEHRLPQLTTAWVPVRSVVDRCTWHRNC